MSVADHLALGAEHEHLNDRPGLAREGKGRIVLHNETERYRSHYVRFVWKRSVYYFWLVDLEYDAVPWTILIRHWEYHLEWLREHRWAPVPLPDPINDIHAEWLASGKYPAGMFQPAL